MTKSNIIFMEGKEKVLRNIFSSSSFGYLAVGYHENTEVSNGFTNSTEDNGFYELIDDSTYQRVPLNFNSIIDTDDDNGTITAKFTAELDLDNIIQKTQINQIAICDSQDKNNNSTIFFAASVIEEITKSEELSLVFVITITM